MFFQWKKKKWMQYTFPLCLHSLRNGHCRQTSFFHYTANKCETHHVINMCSVHTVADMHGVEVLKTWGSEQCTNTAVAFLSVQHFVAVLFCWHVLPLSLGIFCCANLCTLKYKYSCKLIMSCPINFNFVSNALTKRLFPTSSNFRAAELHNKHKQPKWWVVCATDYSKSCHILSRLSL